MSINNFIKEYFSIDQNYIKSINRNNPLTNKDDFFKILSWWMKLSKSNTIGDKTYGGTALIYLKFDGKTYILNSDTTKSGVDEFLKNKNESWKIISNRDGFENKVTNNPNNEAISGFYLYMEK